MLYGRASWLVSECKRTSRGRDSMDTDRACSVSVLENPPNQGMGGEYRSSLAGVIPRDTVIRWVVFSGALPAWPIAMRLCKIGGVGRHRSCRPGATCIWRDATSIREDAFARLERAWTNRYRFRCFQRAPVWVE